MLVPVELSQARAESDLNQDLGGDLSVVSPRESHQSEETLPTVPLGQFQAQRSENTTTNNIAHSKTDTPSQSEIFSGYNNIYNNSSDCETYTSSQSEITTEYEASSEPSSREASRPSSPESGNLSARTVYSPTPEMSIIHRTMHDASHAVREQQGRAVTRSLLNQQKAIAASKFQCNIQIKRTSTPEHPPMSNVPPRQARARSEKANAVTSSSSEESDCEPQTSRMA